MHHVPMISTMLSSKYKYSRALLLQPVLMVGSWSPVSFRNTTESQGRLSLQQQH